MMDAEWMALPPLEEEEEPDLSFPPESRTCFTGSDNLKEGWWSKSTYFQLISMPLHVHGKGFFKFLADWPVKQIPTERAQGHEITSDIAV